MEIIMSKILNELINDEEMSVLNKIDNKELIELLKVRKFYLQSFSKILYLPKQQKSYINILNNQEQIWDRFN